MVRTANGELDQELIRSYLLPALELMALRFRHPIGDFDGAAKPGRAKTCELTVELVQELLKECGKLRTDALRARVAARGQLPATPDEADEWLAAMERDMDAQTQQEAIRNQLDATGYPCKLCNEDIVAGDSVGAGIFGVCHSECLERACHEC